MKCRKNEIKTHNKLNFPFHNESTSLESIWENIFITFLKNFYKDIIKHWILLPQIWKVVSWFKKGQNLGNQLMLLSHIDVFLLPFLAKKHFKKCSQEKKEEKKRQDFSSVIFIFLYFLKIFLYFLYICSVQHDGLIHKQ